MFTLCPKQSGDFRTYYKHLKPSIFLVLIRVQFFRPIENVVVKLKNAVKVVFILFFCLFVFNVQV